MSWTGQCQLGHWLTETLGIREQACVHNLTAALLRPPACSIGQDCQHLRRLHRVLLRLGGGPEPGSWQLERLE